MNNICGKKKKMKECHVGCPTVCGYVAHGVVVKQLPNIFLYSGSWSVEQIDSPSTDFEVGNKDIVNIFSVLEKSQLFGFLGIFWDRTPYHYKTMFPFCLVLDLFPKLSYSPTVAKGMEFAGLCLLFDIGICLGYNRISTSCNVEEFDHPRSVESRIHPEPNTGSGNSLGYLGQADFEERNSSCRSSCIASSQSPMPEFLEMGFEAEQRIIGTSSMLFGVVSYLCSLLFSIDCDHHSIQIEDQCSSALGKIKQIGSQAVVQSDRLTNYFWRQTFQKAA